MSKKSQSIWTRDLLDNPYGRFLMGTALPLAMTAIAIRTFITHKIHFRSYDSEGFEAICVGTGLLAAGAILACSHHWKPRSLRSLKRKNQTMISLFIIFASAIFTAVFRVI